MEFHNTRARHHLYCIAALHGCAQTAVVAIGTNYCLLTGFLMHKSFEYQYRTTTGRFTRLVMWVIEKLSDTF